MSSVTHTFGRPYVAADLETMPDDGHRYEIIDGVLIAGEFTRAEFDALPDDGRRHELIDGTLVVTPAPSWQHRDVALSLAALLRASCPTELKVFVAPLDVEIGEVAVLQPDVLVVPRSVLGAHVLVGLPVLAVEVLSPSTRRLDLTLKRSRYEDAGFPSYWAIDPRRTATDRLGPARGVVHPSRRRPRRHGVRSDAALPGHHRPGGTRRGLTVHCGQLSRLWTTAWEWPVLRQAGRHATGGGP